MRSVARVAVLAFLLSAAAWAQSADSALDAVLSQMDAAARNFKSAEATLVSDRYDKVINETDTETGKVYFRREGGAVEMAVDFEKPDKKYVRYSGGKIQVYLPKIDEVDEYSPGKNRADVEAYLHARLRWQRPRLGQVVRCEASGVRNHCRRQD